MVMVARVRHRKRDFDQFQWALIKHAPLPTITSSIVGAAVGDWLLHFSGAARLVMLVNSRAFRWDGPFIAVMPPSHCSGSSNCHFTVRRCNYQGLHELA